MRRSLDRAVAAVRGPRVPAVVVPLSFTGLSVVRSLRAQGVPVLALELAPREACSYTRLCPTHVVEGGQEELWRAVLEIGERLADRRPALFLTADHDVLEASARRHELEPLFRFSLPPAESVHTLMDKLAFEEFAREHGLPVPRTFSVRDAAGWGVVLREAAFPVIVKPRYRSASWRASGLPKVLRFDSQAALERDLPTLADAEARFVVQEWIDGPDDRLHFFLAYCGADSRPLAAFGCRKLRQWPPRVGSSAAVEAAEQDEVRELAERTFARSRLQGFGALECKIREDGRAVVIEPCVGRVNSQEDVARVNGVDIVYTAYCDLVGLELPSPGHAEPTRWFHLALDLRSALDQRRLGEPIPLPEFLRPYRGRRYYADLDWTDPGPFVVQMAELAARAAAWAGRELAARFPGTTRGRS